MHYNFPLLCRFEVLPTISDPHDSCGSKAGEERLAMAVSKALSRSASQPVVFPSSKLFEKRLKQLTAGGNGSQKQEDDLDIIKHIIEADVSVGSCEEGMASLETLRSQSLSHIPGQFPQTAGSLPSLPHAESMHILHANYNSAPDFMQFGKSHITDFDSMPMGLEGSRHILGQDSQQSPFPGGNFQPGIGGYSGLTGQEEVMGVPGGGAMKNLDGQSVSRRNSLYESHSAVGTPVLTSDSARNTPQGTGSPFDFAHHRDSHIPSYSTLDTASGEGRNTALSAEGFGPGTLKKWNGQPHIGVLSMPNTYQYIPHGDEKGVESGGSDVRTTGDTRLQRRQLKSEDNSPSASGLLCNYLVGRPMEAGPNPGEVLVGVASKQAKSRNCRGDFELNLSLKGQCVYV